jgi:hypothetical protein
MPLHLQQICSKRSSTGCSVNSLCVELVVLSGLVRRRKCTAFGPTTARPLQRITGPEYGVLIRQFYDHDYRNEAAKFRLHRMILAELN